jgi:hypothetical protein
MNERAAIDSEIDHPLSSWLQPYNYYCCCCCYYYYYYYYSYSDTDTHG